MSDVRLLSSTHDMFHSSACSLQLRLGALCEHGAYYNIALVDMHLCPFCEHCVHGCMCVYTYTCLGSFCMGAQLVCVRSFRIMV